MEPLKLNVKKAKKELDTLFSRFIRNRDSICQKCLRTKATQAAHIFSRGRLSTRWDKGNAIGLCLYCHIYWAHREPVEFTLWIINRIGKARFVGLQRKSEKIYDPSDFPKDYEKIKKRLILDLIPTISPSFKIG